MPSLANRTQGHSHLKVDVTLSFEKCSNDLQVDPRLLSLVFAARGPLHPDSWPLPPCALERGPCGSHAPACGLTWHLGRVEQLQLVPLFNSDTVWPRAA